MFNSKGILSFWDTKKEDEDMDRDDAFEIGEEVYYIQDNNIKQGEITVIGIKEKRDRIHIRYKISGQNYNEGIYHNRVFKTKEELVEKIS